MKYLFTHWEKIEKILRRKDIILFLDYDGTITPIVENHDRAFLPKKTRDVLKQLSCLKNLKIAIVSGRSLKDVTKLVGIKGIIYSGNHGFEINGTIAKLPIENLDEYMRELKKIKSELEKKLLKFAGAVIEDKSISLTFHYRMIKNKDVLPAKRIFKRLLKEYIDKEEIRIISGKKVLEIRPPVDWDKGRIAGFILKEAELESSSKKYFPVYIGDDKTDEDAFRILGDKGLCIRVGNSEKSLAHYYLKDSSETAELLQMFLNLKKGGN